jgi:hypothetical protein
LGRLLVTAAVSWALPGSGHWCLGYRVRGVVIGVTLLGTFWLGQSVFGENRAVTRSVHPIFFILQGGSGVSAFIANAYWGMPLDENGYPLEPGQVEHLDHSLPRHLNLGILLTSIAGLLNLLAVLHVLDPRSWTEAQESKSREEESRRAPHAPRGEQTTDKAAAKGMS